MVNFRPSKGTDILMIKVIYFSTLRRMEQWKGYRGGKTFETARFEELLAFSFALCCTLVVWFIPNLVDSGILDLFDYEEQGYYGKRGIITIILIPILLVVVPIVIIGLKRKLEEMHKQMQKVGFVYSNKERKIAKWYRVLIFAPMFIGILRIPLMFV